MDLVAVVAGIFRGGFLHPFWSDDLGGAGAVCLDWLVSLVALALVAYKIYRSHWVALASVVLLGTSEVFLLHARQCRYYSISVFGEILLVYGIHQLFVQNRRGIWFGALALILQFYSNYIIAMANLPGLLVLAWMLRRRGSPPCYA